MKGKVEKGKGREGKGINWRLKMGRELLIIEEQGLCGGRLSRHNFIIS